MPSRPQIQTLENRARRHLEDVQSSHQALLRTAQEKLQLLRMKQGRISAQVEASKQTTLQGRDGSSWGLSGTMPLPLPTLPMMRE